MGKVSSILNALSTADRVGIVIRTLVLLFVLACLISYNGTQVFLEEKGALSFIDHSSDRSGAHVFGPAGATLAAILFHSFGAGSFLIIAGIALMILLTITRRANSLGLVSILLAGLGFVAGCVFFAKLGDSISATYPAGHGGVVGGISRDFLNNYLGNTGSGVVCAVLLGLAGCGVTKLLLDSFREMNEEIAAFEAAELVEVQKMREKKAAQFRATVAKEQDPKKENDPKDSPAGTSISLTNIDAKKGDIPPELVSGKHTIIPLTDAELQFDEVKEDEFDRHFKFSMKARVDLSKVQSIDTPAPDAPQPEQ